MRIIEFTSIFFLLWLGFLPSSYCQLVIKAKENTKLLKSTNTLVDISGDDQLLLHSTSGTLHASFDIESLPKWNIILNRKNVSYEDLILSVKHEERQPMITKKIDLQSFTGSILKHPDSFVGLNVIDNKLYMTMIEAQGDHWQLSWNSKVGSYELSHKKNVNNSAFDCASTVDIEPSLKSDITLKSQACQEADFTIFTDYAFYVNHGSDIGAGLDKILRSFNLMQQDFKNQFDINLSLKHIYFHTCNTCDPWTSSTNVNALLDDFNLKTPPTEMNTINLLLTGRALQNLYVGLAYLNSLCTERAKAVIQDINSADWAQRVVLSHEIAHIFGAVHDDSVPNVMSSNLTNTSEWSSNSISRIEHKLNTSTCLKSCNITSCPDILPIEIELNEIGETVAFWEQHQTERVRYSLFEQGKENSILNGSSDDGYVNIGKLMPCHTYRIELNFLCNDDNTTTFSRTFSTQSHQQMSIESFHIQNCTAASYDLTMNVYHNLTSETPIKVEIAGITYPFSINASTSEILVKGLTEYDQLDVEISISIASGFHLICADRLYFDTPLSDCTLIWNESFNNKQIPDLWQLESTNQEYFQSPFLWKFDDTGRPIGNYGYSMHQISGHTINGSPMAYMDDDYLSFNNYTGTTSMVSTEINLRDHSLAHVSFSYIFHKFIEKGGNNSTFYIDIYDGQTWETIFIASESDCEWFDIWKKECIRQVNLDISAFTGKVVKVRLNYSDGDDEKWTGMIGLDDFQIKAFNPIMGCMDTTAENYNPNATIQLDNQCIYPCENEYLFVREFGENLVIDNTNHIEITGDSYVTQNSSFYAQKSITLLPGFNIEMGSTITLEQKQCSQD